MKTFEEYHARLEAFCRRPYSPDEAAELLHELESYVAANKHDLTLVAKPKTGLQRAAWRLQGHDARHRARQRQAIHTLFDVPVSQADEFLEALQSVASHATESHPERSRLDVARALAGYPPAGQPFERPSATRALSMIRRLTRTEARRIVDEIFRRADLFGDDPPGPLVILKQALTVGYMEAGFLACALLERAGILDSDIGAYMHESAFTRMLAELSTDHAQQIVDGTDKLDIRHIGLNHSQMDIVRGVAQRNIDTEAPYDDICPEDAWRELADLAAPELADRFHELDSAQQPFTAWRYGNDPASRQLAQAVSRLPANAHIRGLQRAAGLARFASIDAVGRLGLRSGDGREELIAAIDHLSEADARSLLHDLAMWAPDRAWNSIRHEAFFDGLILLY